MLGFAIITAIFVLLCSLYWVFGPLEKQKDNSLLDEGLNRCCVAVWIIFSILWTAVIFDMTEASKSVFGYLGMLLVVASAFFIVCALVALVIYLIAKVFFHASLDGY